MLVRLCVPRASIAGAQDIGDILDVPDDEAFRMFAKGHAEPVRQAAKETAVPRRKAERAAK